MDTINFFAVLVAAISGMALGALWYSPVAFGNAWMRELGLNAESLGSPAPAMAGSMIACLVTALALESLFVFAGGGGLVDGLRLGLLVGIGIVATAIMSDALFSGWSWRLYFIQAGYRVAYIIIMGVIIGLWPR